MDVLTTVLASLTDDECRTSVKLQQTGGANGESWGGSGTRVTLELGSGC